MLKERVERLGFSHLLSLQRSKLPHDLLAVILQRYDPPTKEFVIRGITKKINLNDVKAILKLPCTGKKVRWDIKEDEPAYRRLKSKFHRMKFADVFGLIKEVKDEKEFDMLFMIYTLGTFLCPSASPNVSEHLLRVVHHTSGGFNQFDWASYILEDLHQEMTHYVNHIKTY